MPGRRLSSIGRIVSLILLALLTAFPTKALAGYLYLLNDDSTGNRIYGFQGNETTGTLTALPAFRSARRSEA